MWEDIIYHSQQCTRTALSHGLVSVDDWLSESRPRTDGSAMHPIVVLKSGRGQKVNKYDLSAEVEEVCFVDNAEKKKAALTVTDALRLVMQVSAPPCL